jgi:hypothetical protein
MFDNLLGRFVGPGNKVIGFEIVYDPVLSIPGVFASATVEGGSTSIDKELLGSLLRISTNYINGVREKTKAKVLTEVETAVTRTGTEGMSGVMTELQGKLAEAWIGITADIKRIVETEISNASNQGLHSSISRVSESMGVADPVVFKVVVKDELLCDICKALWLLSDGVTPRVYHMSELQHGYMDNHHNPFATVGPTHPHCRCTMTMLIRGYGFNSAGLVTWIGMDHDELKAQRG